MSTTYGKMAVNHATRPSDSMPLHTHSQMRNQPSARQPTRGHTSPPVSKSDGETADQSVTSAQSHVSRPPPRQCNASASKYVSARRSRLLLLLLLLLLLSLLLLLLLRLSSAQGSGD